MNAIKPHSEYYGPELNEFHVFNPTFVAHVHAKRRREKDEAEARQRREAIARRATVTPGRHRRRTEPFRRLKNPPFATRADRIIIRLCNAYQVTPSQVRSGSRRQRIVICRQAIFYWLSRLTTMSFPAIGVKVGRRDHTTVMHGARVYPAKRAAMGRKLGPAR